MNLFIKDKAWSSSTHPRLHFLALFTWYRQGCEEALYVIIGTKTCSIYVSVAAQRQQDQD